MHTIHVSSWTTIVVHSRDEEGYVWEQTMKQIHLKSVTIFLEDDGAALGLFNGIFYWLIN